MIGPGHRIVFSSTVSASEISFLPQKIYLFHEAVSGPVSGYIDLHPPGCQPQPSAVPRLIGNKILAHKKPEPQKGRW